MLDMNTRIAESQERAKQEERRLIRDKNREKDRQRKIAIRRQLTVGEIVIKYFPTVMELQPQLNRADTDLEFAGLEKFISTVAGDPKYVALYQDLVSVNGVGANSQER